jgi:PKD repeat protein
MQMKPFAAVLVAGLIAGGCAVHQTEEPPLAGPSELAQSIAVTASPDTINVGSYPSTAGDSSTILVLVRDSTGRPKSNQTVRLSMLVGAAQEDCGQLTPRTLTTDTNGRATAVFTAPGQPLPQPECLGFTAPGTVTVFATVVGTNYQTSGAQSASIHMLVPAVIQPAGGVIVNFTYSPLTVQVGADITFSDAGSLAAGGCAISTYQWFFNDGITKTGAVVLHDFAPAGTYTAQLVVTDSCGNQGSKSASFVITP